MMHHSPPLLPEDCHPDDDGVRRAARMAVAILIAIGAPLDEVRRDTFRLLERLLVASGVGAHAEERFAQIVHDEVDRRLAQPQILKVVPTWGFMLVDPKDT